MSGVNPSTVDKIVKLSLGLFRLYLSPPSQTPIGCAPPPPRENIMCPHTLDTSCLELVDLRYSSSQDVLIFLQETLMSLRIAHNLYKNVTPLIRLYTNHSANVYDKDQGLTGRYHNTTLDTN